MKKICLLLAAVMLFGCFAMTACAKDNEGGDAAARSLDEVDMHDIVKAVDGVLPYEGLVGGFVYKEDDTYELAYTLYYMWDTS